MMTVPRCQHLLPPSAPLGLPHGQHMEGREGRLSKSVPSKYSSLMAAASDSGLTALSL
jgi:hypothetical protein